MPDSSCSRRRTRSPTLSKTVYDQHASRLALSLRERPPVSPVLSGSADSRATSRLMRAARRTCSRVPARHRSPARDKLYATSSPRYRRLPHRPSGQRRSRPRARRYQRVRPERPRVVRPLRGAVSLPDAAVFRSRSWRSPVAERVRGIVVAHLFGFGRWRPIDQSCNRRLLPGRRPRGTDRVDSSTGRCLIATRGTRARTKRSYLEGAAFVRDGPTLEGSEIE
jgi:hypothetical protein